MIITLDDSLQEIHSDYWDKSEDVNRTIINKLGWDKYTAVDKNPENGLKNSGLLGLLSKAYSQHLPVTINPHDVWVLVLSQATLAVVKNPEAFRDLFTDSKDKQEISVPSGDWRLPTERVVHELNNKIKFDYNVIFPDLSTYQNDSVILETVSHLFLEMASPYYDYSCFACGIPEIKLGGTKQDWLNVLAHWRKLSNLFFGRVEYTDKFLLRVEEYLHHMVAREYDNLFWRSIFTQRNVGSGSELQIDGWITEFFYDDIKFKKLENMTQTYGVVKYLFKNENQRYASVCGGFSWYLEPDGFYALKYNKLYFKERLAKNTTNMDDIVSVLRKL